MYSFWSSFAFLRSDFWVKGAKGWLNTGVIDRLHDIRTFYWTKFQERRVSWLYWMIVAATNNRFPLVTRGRFHRRERRSSIVRQKNENCLMTRRVTYLPR